MVRITKILKTQIHPNTAAHLPLPRHARPHQAAGASPPNLQEANADCANAGRGAHGPAAGGGVGAWGVRGGAFEPRNLQQCVLHYYS